MDQLPDKEGYCRRNTMKNHVLAKAGCRMLIGAVTVLLPLGAAQADNTDRMQHEKSGSGWSTEQRTTPPSDTPPSMQYDSQSAPQGAQGPIRSDMSDNRTPERIRNEHEQMPREWFQERRALRLPEQVERRE
jgi:hypothetical protein